MNLSVLLLTVLIPAVQVAHGAVYAGLETNSSNNILLRPGAISGTMASMQVGMSRSVGNVALSYNGTGGVLERYEGLQYHLHRFSASYVHPPVGKWNLTADVTARLARYGDVSLFDRMNEYTIRGQAKRYLSPTLLFRWEGAAGSRSYTPFETESATNFETMFRLDRFFGTGTTLRGQVDFGARRSTRLPNRRERDMPAFTFARRSHWDRCGGYGSN